MATISSQAHDFFYKGVNAGANKHYKGCSLSYEGKVAYSYATVIAKVIPRRGYGDSDITTDDVKSAFTLVTHESMTPSTGRHYGNVVAASPFPVIRVPFKYGHRWDPSPRTLADFMLEDLKVYAKYITNADFRAKFILVMESRNTIVKEAAEPWAKAFDIKEFDEYKVIFKNLDQYVKEAKQKRRAEAAKRAAETRKALAKWLGKERKAQDSIDFIRTVFSDDPSFCYHLTEMTYNERAALRRKLDTDEYAYVWIEDTELVTSRHVRVSLDVAKVAMKAWALGHDMRGFKVDMFSVVKYEGDTIQIGCHKIPRENMLALYEVVMGKPFPKKEDAV